MTVHKTAISFDGCLEACPSRSPALSLCSQRRANARMWQRQHGPCRRPPLSLCATQFVAGPTRRATISAVSARSDRLSTRGCARHSNVCSWRAAVQIAMMSRPSHARGPAGSPGTSQPALRPICCRLRSDMLFPARGHRLAACTPRMTAGRPPAQQRHVTEAHRCQCAMRIDADVASPPRRRRTRVRASAAAAAVEHSVVAGSFVDAATALKASMAAAGGLPEQLARPSSVPSDVGGTALGFVCSRDVQSGEVFHLELWSWGHGSAEPVVC